MNKLLLYALSMLAYLPVTAQQVNSDKDQIKQTLSTFMDCLVKKDSVEFYNLFAPEPVVWIGVFKEKSQQDRMQNKKAIKDYFTSTYQKFYRSISESGTDEEKFYNVQIIEDGSIASVIFDYSFWEKGEKINWGKESWAMVKLNGVWKISAVLFSLEMENVNPEPKRSRKKRR